MRRRWRDKGYSEDMCADHYGFLDITDMDIDEIGAIIKNSLRIGNMKESVLCDPALGRI